MASVWWVASIATTPIKIYFDVEFSDTPEPQLNRSVSEKKTLPGKSGGNFTPGKWWVFDMGSDETDYLYTFKGTAMEDSTYQDIIAVYLTSGDIYFGNSTHTYEGSWYGSTPIETSFKEGQDTYRDFTIKIRRLSTIV